MDLFGKKSDLASPLRSEDVLAAERKCIAEARHAAVTAPLTALCLSGGGIRSAATSLGAIQAFAELGVLDRFDYISTVSGGGYAGSWLSVWQAREGGLHEVLNNLIAHGPDSEPAAIGFVRSHCDYLGSTLRILPSYLGSLYLNLSILATLLALLFLVPYALPRLWVLGHQSVLGLALPSAAVPAILFGIAIYLVTFSSSRSEAVARRLLFSALMLLFVTALFETFFGYGGSFVDIHPRLFTAVGTGAALGGLTLGYRGPNSNMLRVLIWAALAGLSRAALTLLIVRFAPGVRELQPSVISLQMLPLWYLASCSAPLILFTSGSRVLDWIREFEAATRFFLWNFAAGVLWWLIIGFTFHGIEWHVMLSGLHPWVPALLRLATFVAVPIGAALAVSIAAQKQSTPIGPFQKTMLVLAALLCAFYMCLTIATTEGAMLRGFLSGLDMDPLPITSPQYWEMTSFINRASPVGILLFAGFLCFGLILLVRIASVGQFSFHQFYSVRLVGAFLRASRTPSLGDWGRDDCPVCFLPPRPLLVMNMSVNLPDSDDEGSEAGRIGSFTVTPLHAGSERLGYRPVSQYAGRLTVGRAIAISGAAVSPNLAWRTFPLASFFMSVLNINLGAWVANPGQRSWRRFAPPDLLMRFFRESAGRGSSKSKFVYLSDGGHFENLGIYEMIKRRCRVIVALDNGCDPAHRFEDLAVAIRKARLNLHVPIEIDVLPMLESPLGGKRHYLLGRIRYSVRYPGEPDGVLMLVKPTLTGDEPVEVLLHAKSHPAFPQDPTSQQVYSEGQFESYRLLGRHLINSADETGNWWHSLLSSFTVLE